MEASLVASPNRRTKVKSSSFPIPNGSDKYLSYIVSHSTWFRFVLNGLVGLEESWQAPCCKNCRSSWELSKERQACSQGRFPKALKHSRPLSYLEKLLIIDLINSLLLLGRFKQACLHSELRKHSVQPCKAINKFVIVPRFRRKKMRTLVISERKILISKTPNLCSLSWRCGPHSCRLALPKRMSSNHVDV